MKKENSLLRLQHEVDTYIKAHGGYWNPLSMLSAIMEEVGELAREINHLEGFKPKKASDRAANMGEELGDLIFAIICMANYYNVNLETEFYQILTKFQKRDANRFT